MEEPLEIPQKRRKINFSAIFTKKNLLIGFIVLVIFYGIYRIPAVYNRVNSRWADLSSRVIYYFNPPDEVVFLPQEEFQIALVVQATLSALTQVVEPSPTATMVPDQESIVPTITPTPLPEKAIIEDIVYVHQQNRWNYCGPANLTMSLKYWGWDGDRDDVASVIKPGENDPDLDFIQRGLSDKNVMPYEMTKYVRDYTYFDAVLRVGGNLDLLKKLISNGYPVVIEKGYYETTYTGDLAWMGHYWFVTGYDDSLGSFIVQDAYLQPGDNIESDYESFLEGWRAFNYLFFVVYPPENESEVFEILGPWADENWANLHALEIAEREITEDLDEMAEYFAWFNKGTSHVALDQYQAAATAYDNAFFLYNKMEGEASLRPYRMMWYQSGPYWAYFFTQRYTDLINLANTTLNEWISQPTLEESLYWRGRAYLAEGQYQDAVADFRESVYLNENYAPGISILTQLGEPIDD
ncbi:MAG: tetratricopeptide repeat protein [Chloroflexi bacterium]|jgi:tetratricopeptide (TPR) repeat protein|nr:tetratricopeptide repeat protein [Chloroflexota bacterium]MBT3671002.1 tetratricopeptide repeat protein [Chloroflexota bacterium]MBT4002332.1 tetratricopeptide repeat protein [Chloroflexota bacterium]MBT4305035.1 tetratricopeptide repeat protein [Chloroflexota bacterium]MBT4533846.1 tetratricopeptide repeat protein [Chloroflexota bacterium]